MKNFGGEILFLDRLDINTDEIIPARYLTEITKEALKPYLLEDIKLDGFLPEKDLFNKKVVISRSNFGCGSSREHAPWAFEVNGINVIIASSYARIFRQNMFNCGMLAIELSEDIIDGIFNKFSDKKAFLEMDFENSVFVITSEQKTQKIEFSVSEFDADLVKSGGWVNFADERY